MSLPPKDLRAAIPAELHGVLSAYASAHGIEIQEIVRDVLGKWARQQVHAATVLHSALKREGLLTEELGAVTESHGTTRTRRE